MKESLRAALNWEPCELFAKKACHVFAVELLKYLGAGGWQLFRIGMKEPPPRRAERFKAALHVCIGKDGRFLDVFGEHSEQELLSSWRVKWPEVEGIFPCKEAELFATAEAGEETGDEAALPDFSFSPELLRALADQPNDARSQYGLALDCEFINCARVKAKVQIESNATKYLLE